MNPIYNYLSFSKLSNATKAITYQPYVTYCMSVMDCYYNYYDPVKGYSLSYPHRDQRGCMPEREIQHLLLNKLYSLESIFYIPKE